MRILLTGGGTGGHIIPNLAVIEELIKKDKSVYIFYIGSKNGIEKRLIEDRKIKYYPISCGKLRRYFSLENFFDFFRFLIGIFQSFFIIGREKPDIIFSKGGFVSLPVAIAGYLRGVAVYIHESDLSPGLANKIALRFSKKAFLSFEESKKQIKNYKGEIIISGTPVRSEVLLGNRERAMKKLGFENKKSVLFVLGGSTGAKEINDLIFQGLDELLKNFNIIHQCGSGKVVVKKQSGYKQFEYIKEEFPDYLALADIIVSRAGANSLFEMALAKKRVVVIPMESGRGDQIENAEIFSKELKWPVLRGKIEMKDLLKSISIVMETEIKSSKKFINGAKVIAETLLK